MKRYLPYIAAVLAFGGGYFLGSRGSSDVALTTCEASLENEQAASESMARGLRICEEKMDQHKVDQH